jgi:protocatechuate 3,4-dioxygenase beta subunit
MTCDAARRTLAPGALAGRAASGRQASGTYASEPRTAATAWSAADLYVPPVEVIEEESSRPAHGHFNVIHHDTTIRADIYLPGDQET